MRKYYVIIILFFIFSYSCSRCSSKVKTIAPDDWPTDMVILTPKNFPWKIQSAFYCAYGICGPTIGPNSCYFRTTVAAAIRKNKNGYQKKIKITHGRIFVRKLQIFGQYTHTGCGLYIITENSPAGSTFAACQQ